jgi:pimeloyl-ACP methyl ester carboxylesterase
MTTTITTTDKTELYARDWGSGPPVILLHGWPLSADSWDDQAVATASARAAAKGIANSRLVEYDGAPHGLFATEKDRLTRDLLAFLRE